ncbi:MAG: hypothetical protein IIA75_07505 [Proteobacteria bacterium]|nr:hypothetical protein [Pseudomonadota bacterium]
MRSTVNLDQSGGLARQVIVKPTPKPPITGAVVSITTDEKGVRTMSIMRPDGSTKVVRLGSKGQPPEVGDLVTAFQGRGGDDDGEDGDEEDGPRRQETSRAHYAAMNLSYNLEIT